MSSPPPGWTASASSPAAIVSAPGPPSTVSAPGPDSIVTCSVSASAIRIVSAPAPERIAILLNVARLKSKPLTSSVLSERARTVIESAAPSPVTVSVSPETEGMTDAFAAVGSASAVRMARTGIRSMARILVLAARALYG